MSGGEFDSLGVRPINPLNEEGGQGGSTAGMELTTLREAVEKLDRTLYRITHQLEDLDKKISNLRGDIIRLNKNS